MSQDCIICFPSAQQAASICDECMLVHETPRREALFKSILNGFGVRASADFNLLKATCKNLMNLFSKIEFNFTPITTFNRRDHTISIDDTALTHMKDQKRFDNYVPIKSEPDGNCLYYSIKQLMPDMIATVTELRVRSMVEIVNNHISYEEQYPQLVHICDEVKEYCSQVKDKEHAQLWDIIGLCHVLKCRIYLMCAKDPPIHPLQNNTYTPIIDSQNITTDITLMWTNTISKNELERRKMEFIPDHFVSLLRRSNIQTDSGNVPTCFYDSANV